LRDELLDFGDTGVHRLSFRKAELDFFGDYYTEPSVETAAEGDREP